MQYVTDGVMFSLKWSVIKKTHVKQCNWIKNEVSKNAILFIKNNTWSAQYAVSVIKRSSVCQSICLSRRLTVAAATGGFAADVGRRQQISIDSCCCRATCGPRKFWSDCKEVQHVYTLDFRHESSNATRRISDIKLDMNDKIE